MRLIHKTASINSKVSLTKKGGIFALFLRISPRCCTRDDDEVTRHGLGTGEQMLSGQLLVTGDPVSLLLSGQFPVSDVTISWHRRQDLEQVLARDPVPRVDSQCFAVLCYGVRGVSCERTQRV